MKDVLTLLPSTLQPSQPLPRIINFREAGIGIFPEGEEFPMLYVESFNGKLRDELFNGEIFDTVLEASVLLEHWRREYNCYRPHSALGDRAPAPEALRPNILSLKVIH